MKTSKNLLVLSLLMTAGLVACDTSTSSSAGSSSTGSSETSQSSESSSVSSSTDSQGGDSESSSSSSSTPVEEEYVIRITSQTGVSLVADKTKAKAGETVTITAEVDAGFTLLGVTYNGEAANKVNDTTYTFEMPSQSVIVQAKLSVSGDVTIQGDFTAAFVKDEATGIYSAKGVTAEGDGNFSVIIAKDGVQTTLYQWDIDRTKCFGNLEISRGDYTGCISDGGTYDFYYDPSSPRPLYIQRTKVNVLPNSVDSLYNLFYGRVQSSAGNFAPGLTGVEYSNSEEQIKTSFQVSKDKKTSLLKVTDLFGVEKGVVYKSLDEENGIFSWVDTTVTFEGQNGRAGKYKLSETNELTGSEIDNQEWNNDSQYINPLVAPFEVTNTGYDMYNVEFDFMDAYRVGMTVEDYVKSSSVEISSTAKSDGGFTTTIKSARTYDSTGATDSTISKIQEHTEFRVTLEFTSTGALTKVDYLKKSFDDTKYDFAADKFISGTADENFATSGTIAKDLDISYTYNAPVSTIDYDTSAYFVTSIDSVTINNPDAEGTSGTNTLNCGDVLTESEYTEIQVSPSTALDKWQYDVVSSENTDVVRWNDSYNRFEAINEGDATVRVSNLSDQKAYKDVDIHVVYNIDVHSYYIMKYSYNGVDLDVDTSTSATIYAGGVYRFGLHALAYGPGTVALPPDTKVTFEGESYGLETYIDTVDSRIDFDTTKVSISEEVTVDFTISTDAHADGDQGSTEFSLTIRPSQGATIENLKGNWKNTEKNATINIAEDLIEVDGVSVNHGTISVDSQTYNFCFLVDAATGRFSQTHIIDGNKEILGSYYLLLTYDSELGLGVNLSSSEWGGLDEVSTSYILGDESGDEDLTEYTYDYFTKA